MNKVCRIILTESAFALAITSVALMTAGNSIDVTRAIVAALVALRIAGGLVRVIASNFVALRKKAERNGMSPVHA